MPEMDKIVINTGPVLALIAGLGSLEILRSLYEQVVVPYEVCQELLDGGASGFGVKVFCEADFLVKNCQPSAIQPYLINSLDPGEAAVIQTAIEQDIPTVCIDEALGRRMARLHGLTLTGSLGIIVRAKREGYLPTTSLQQIISRMQGQGIYLSKRLISLILKQVNE